MSLCQHTWNLPLESTRGLFWLKSDDRISSKCTFLKLTLSYHAIKKKDSKQKTIKGDFLLNIARKPLSVSFMWSAAPFLQPKMKPSRLNAMLRISVTNYFILRQKIQNVTDSKQSGFFSSARICDRNLQVPSYEALRDTCHPVEGQPPEFRSCRI